MRLFGYILDLCICNSWIWYERDCSATKSTPMPLKDFRLDIYKGAMSYKKVVPKVTRTSLARVEVPLPKRGQRAEVPSVEKRQDATALHLPHHVTMRQTCKYCSHKGAIQRSRWMCEVCKVSLCLSDAKNCFANFHKNL